MRKFASYLLACLLFLACLGETGCSSSNHKKPHGKLKKGKRIPCPLKDC